MSAKILSNKIFQALRQKAERLVDRQGHRFSQPGEEEWDLMRLAHEVEVQYVELELQNEELRRTANELEASRDAFAELYHTAPVGFVTLNRQGAISRVNVEAAGMLGDPGQILIGRLFLLLIHPQDRGIFQSHLRNITEAAWDVPVDLRLLNAVQEVIHAQVRVTGNQDPSDNDRWRLALVDVTERKRNEDELLAARAELENRVRERTAELEHRTRQLARLTSELTLAEQRERRRLADLLHDHLQQMLAGARLNLEMLGAEQGLKHQQLFQDAYQLVMDAIATARSLSAELSPPVLYLQGLSGALEWLARWMRQTHKLTVDVAADRSSDPLREDLKVLLFQSVRELLFNVAKHAGTSSARVEMTRRNGRTRIVVSDPGKGFDVPSFWQQRPAVEGGFGLFSIRERLDLLGGRFDVESRPGRGATATIDLPLQTVAQSHSSADISGVPKPPAGVAAPPSPGNGDKIRILLVDDHAMMRKGLSLLLAGHGDIEIAGEAEDGRQAVELARRIHPDIILMDINMPVMNGLEATQHIHAELPATRIIGLSMHAVEDQARAMREAGAVDYLNKSGNPSILLKAIRENAG